MHSSIKGNINVLKSMLNKKTAVIALAGTAVLGGGVAVSYTQHRAHETAAYRVSSLMV
jgi:hypothetical protein